MYLDISNLAKKRSLFFFVISTKLTRTVRERNSFNVPRTRDIRPNASNVTAQPTMMSRIGET
jgi:hypothetical protein